eukprot:3110410-Pleurochrysis_carterae.AAC.2
MQLHSCDVAMLHRQGICRESRRLGNYFTDIEKLKRAYLRPPANLGDRRVLQIIEPKYVTLLPPAGAARELSGQAEAEAKGQDADPNLAIGSSDSAVLGLDIAQICW